MEERKKVLQTVIARHDKGSIYAFMLLKKAVLVCLSLSLLFIARPSFAQLKVVVHIWGEVRSPGEYTVPAGTNILELISKAGGPTEYANMGKVKLTHPTKQSKRAMYF